jgi:NAD(P)-dependent dehydrogenase (short-subunit alcohol dehydrogenase family)
MGDLDGKVALVTGATQAMGEAIARRLAADGAAILGVGRSEGRGRAVADRLVADGYTAEFINADVGVEAQAATVVAAAVERFGGLDIVVNNAAALDGDTPESPVHLEPTELFDSIMKVNLYGPFWFAKYAIPVMLASGRGGSFINISSYAAQRGVAAIPAYSASKGALEALTRQIAVDYAEYGIRTNTVVLGSMSVPRNSALHQDEAVASALRQGRMISRFGNPDDTASAVGFLASPGAGYITGTTLNVDGGLLVKAPVALVAQQLTENLATGRKGH